MRTLSVGSQGKNSYSIFPLPGPKDAGEKETPYPKTSTYLVPLLNETGLKVEKKKKKVLLLPQHCFPKQQNHFYVKYIQKTDSIDCDRETSTMKRFLPDSFQMKRKKIQKKPTEGFQNRGCKSLFFTGKYLQNSHCTSFLIKLHILPCLQTLTYKLAYC